MKESETIIFNIYNKNKNNMRKFWIYYIKFMYGRPVTHCCSGN